MAYLLEIRLARPRFTEALGQHLLHIRNPEWTRRMPA